MINIVLHEPEIPQNTGNISRTCAVTGAALHLIKPLGFEITDKHLKRAGLDYWDQLDVRIYESIEDFYVKNPGACCFYMTTKAEKAYTDFAYPEDCFLVFGKETKGLPDAILEANKKSCCRIPMRNTLRCLNLSNSVAVAVYEVLRQHGFAGLK